MTGTIDVPATPDNRLLAERVAARMAADSRIVNAKAAFWRLMGVGSLVCLTGIGAAAAILAYSRYADVTVSSEKIAAALAEALQKSTLKTEGTVVLGPDATVSLASNRLVLDNAKVGLEPGSRVALQDGGTVAIKPGATVGVAGTVQASGTVNVAGQIQQASTGEDVAGIRRSIEALRQDRRGASPETSANGSKVVDSYTTFKTVSYPGGYVVTGWNWGASTDQEPKNQYCYYEAATDGAKFRIDLAMNGVEKPVTKAPRGFQAQEAASNCIWFDGTRTKSRSIFD